jgi:hypothetical protein
MALESERGPACAHKRMSQDTIAKIRDFYRELIARGITSGELREEVRELGGAMLMGMMREVIMTDVESDSTSPATDRVSGLLSVFIEGAGVR